MTRIICATAVGRYREFETPAVAFIHDARTPYDYQP